jgi:hypothetical protein
MIGFDSCVTRTHGQAARGGTGTYHAWRDMRRRCTDPSSADWVRYGGRGITVCSRWDRFDDFLADMGQRPDGVTLDRINNDGNYDPDNCRWTTWHEQGRNRRSNGGERHPNAELSVDDVFAIRFLAGYGATYRYIASEFGVSHANVGYIVRREAWRDPVEDDRQPQSARQRSTRDLGA